MKRTKTTPNLDNDIRVLFSSNKEDEYTIRNVIDALGLSHKAYSSTEQILNKYIETGFLKKERGKYFVNLSIKNNSKMLDQSPNLIEGIFDATPLARNYSYAFVTTNQGDFFVSSEDTLNAFHGDSVAIEPYYRKQKSDYCYIRRIIKRASDTLAGDIQNSNGKYYFICSNPKIYQWFEVSDIGTATNGMKVMLKITNWGNRNFNKMPVGVVCEVLGLSGNPETELLAVIRQNNLPLEFPDNVIEEIALLPDGIDLNEIVNRHDLRNLLTFTIDPASAKDYDDAISIIKTERGWQLYVHIADVAHYIKTKSKLFSECINRGNSYYFPRKVIPMLPEKLSNKLCSLRQNEDKLTMTVYTEFDLKGNIKTQELYESVINSNCRLSYEQVDDIFNNNQTEINSEIIDALNISKQLSAVLSRKRNKAGYLFFDLPETEYLYNDEGFINQMNQSIETESHKLIENFMLVANQFVAERLTKLSPVTMYRVHELPEIERLNKLNTLLNAYGLELKYKATLNLSMQSLLSSFPDETYHKVFDKIVLRSLKKAKYTTEHLPHFGLAIETYTHFTSPIRRLCDLTIHHLCKKYIIKSSSEEITKKQVISFANIASEKELIADTAEREIEKVMNKIFIKDHIGDYFYGIITGMNSSSIFIMLNDYPITGVLKTSQLPKGKWIYNDVSMRYQNPHTGIYYQLMDYLKVQIMQVSDDVYLDLVNDESTPQHHYSKVPTKLYSRYKSNSKYNSKIKNSKKKRSKQ